jgi:hypothetical protein
MNTSGTLSCCVNGIELTGFATGALVSRGCVSQHCLVGTFTQLTDLWTAVAGSSCETLIISYIRHLTYSNYLLFSSAFPVSRKLETLCRSISGNFSSAVKRNTKRILQGLLRISKCPKRISIWGSFLHKKNGENTSKMWGSKRDS